MSRTVEVSFRRNDDEEFIIKCKEGTTILDTKRITVEQGNYEKTKEKALEIARKSRNSCQFDGVLT